MNQNLIVNSFSVDLRPETNLKVGSVEGHWVGDTLTVTAVMETQSCGGVFWEPRCLLNGNEIKVIATGRGVAMNCPPSPAKFIFSISAEKGNYTFTADITEDLSLTMEEYNKIRQTQQ